MEITKLSEDVYEINNFLTGEELEEVCKIINGAKEEDWFSENTTKDKDFADFWEGKNLQPKENAILDIISFKMESLFESYSEYPGKILLQRYKKGDFIKAHTDQWNPDLPYYVGYGLCLYYNDNYQGGQLEYPELGIAVKPKQNSLYVHGGHVMHGSLPVLDDQVRYFSTAFVRGTKDKPTKLRKELFK
jgi:hypothetical protein